MSFDIGSTVEGTIVKLADYGAIVRLQGGNTGLIHISEIADTFVRDVKDYFKEHDRVRVKVLSVNNKGRYELSTKQVEQPVIESSPPREPRKAVERLPEEVNLGPEEFGSRARHRSPVNFEERLTQFMKDSQERLLDLKRNIEAKRGTKRR
ncbi:MAG TPA: S1 RNA-binding domain-containing protein [Armatimonadota bacterium]|nr:S1 RNA-binding domain-containing protein [Armatimonadota bacterium]